MTASKSSGFGQLRSSTRKQAQWSNSNSLPQSVGGCWQPRPTGERGALRISNYISLGNGVGAVFLANCGKNFNSMSSGELDWVAVVKAPIGSTCSRYWCVIGYWIQAVSGAFTEYGLSTRRWVTCSQRTSRLPPKTLFIDVWTLWSNIKKSSLNFCTRDGRHSLA